jgi:hypothetical protein
MQNINFRNIHATIEKKSIIKNFEKLRNTDSYIDFVSLLNHNKFGKGITSKLDFCVFHHQKFKFNAEQILGPPK